MTRRETRIVYAAVAVAVLLLVVRGLPVVTGIYAERQASIELIRDDMARELALSENTELWRQRREEIEARLGSLDAQVFHGGTLPLLTANIQRMVRQYATETGVTINSTRLAESRETDGWLLVEQELSFTMDNQSNTLGFLRRLEESTPWLGVSSFTMRRSRNLYTGSITVVGFSRVNAAAQAAPAQARAASSVIGRPR